MQFVWARQLHSVAEVGHLCLTHFILTWNVLCFIIKLAPTLAFNEGLHPPYQPSPFTHSFILFIKNWMPIIHYKLCVRAKHPVFRLFRTQFQVKHGYVCFAHTLAFPNACINSRYMKSGWLLMRPWGVRHEPEMVLAFQLWGWGWGLWKELYFRTHKVCGFWKNRKDKSITSCKITFCWRPVDATSENNLISVLFSTWKWLCESWDGNSPLKKIRKIEMEIVGKNKDGKLGECFELLIAFILVKTNLSKNLEMR